MFCQGWCCWTRGSVAHASAHEQLAWDCVVLKSVSNFLELSNSTQVPHFLMSLNSQLSAKIYCFAYLFINFHWGKTGQYTARMYGLMWNSIWVVSSWRLVLLISTKVITPQIPCRATQALHPSRWCLPILSITNSSVKQRISSQFANHCASDTDINTWGWGKMRHEGKAHFTSQVCSKLQIKEKLWQRGLFASQGMGFLQHIPNRVLHDSLLTLCLEGFLRSNP